MLKVLDDLGYDEKSQGKILSSHAVNRYSFDTLEKLVLNTFNFLKISVLLMDRLFR